MENLSSIKILLWPTFFSWITFTIWSDLFAGMSYVYLAYYHSFRALWAFLAYKSSYFFNFCFQVRSQGFVRGWLGAKTQEDCAAACKSIQKERVGKGSVLLTLITEPQDLNCLIPNYLWCCLIYFWNHYFVILFTQHEPLFGSYDRIQFLRSNLCEQSFTLMVTALIFVACSRCSSYQYIYPYRYHLGYVLYVILLPQL